MHLLKNLELIMIHYDVIEPYDMIKITKDKTKLLSPFVAAIDNIEKIYCLPFLFTN